MHGRRALPEGIAMAVTVPDHKQTMIRSGDPVSTIVIVDRWTLTGTSPCRTCACTGGGRAGRRG